MQVADKVKINKVYARYSDNEITFGLSIEEGNF